MSLNQPTTRDRIRNAGPVATAWAVILLIVAVATLHGLLTSPSPVTLTETVLGVGAVTVGGISTATICAYSHRVITSPETDTGTDGKPSP